MEIYTEFPPCMKDGKCCKRFPRQLLNETQSYKDGYPLHCRLSSEDGGYETIIHGNKTVIVDNQWTVQYNRLL